MYSLILHLTTDLTNLDQFAFVLRNCANDEFIKNWLFYIDETVDSTENGMYNIFYKVCVKYNLNFGHDLIGQGYDAYDGASNIQGIFKRLRSLIHNDNKNSLHVECNAHYLNLVVVDCYEVTACPEDFFDTIRNLIRLYSI